MRLRYICLQDENGRLRCVPEAEARQDKPTINVITDDMDATQHPCDHKFYTSKSRFREVTRQHDKIEVGNEYNAFMSLKPTDPRPSMTDSLKKAWEYHQTIMGKSDGERKEIEHRFFGPEQD